MRVTPLHDTFADQGHGMTVFLENWGGEAIYWAQDEAPELAATIERLNALSQPAIVRLGIPASTLDRFPKLWPVVVGQLDGWPQAYHGFIVRKSVGPASIKIQTSRSTEWPVN